MNVLEMCVNSPYKGSINAGNNDIILSIILDPVELEESHYYPRRVPVKSSSFLYDGSDRKLMSRDRKYETTWDSGPQWGQLLLGQTTSRSVKILKYYQKIVFCY